LAQLCLGVVTRIFPQLFGIAAWLLTWACPLHAAKNPAENPAENARITEDGRAWKLSISELGVIQFRLAVTLEKAGLTST
jgi:hypothetical protein